MKILVVDDDALQLDIISSKFRASGNDVVVAHSGEAALSLVQSRDFDLVIVDVRMPGGMDGLELARRIRASGRNPAIVGMSGSPPPESPCLPLEIDRFVQKTMPDFFRNLTTAATEAVQRAAPAEPVAGLLIPRYIAWGTVVTIVGMVATGSWYMSTQAGNATHLADEMRAFKTDLAARDAARDTAIQAAGTSATTATNDVGALQTDVHRSIADVDRRLNEVNARVNDESGQITTQGQRVATIEGQLRVLGDHITQPPLPVSARRARRSGGEE